MTDAERALRFRENATVKAIMENWTEDQANNAMAAEFAAVRAEARREALMEAAELAREYPGQRGAPDDFLAAEKWARSRIAESIETLRDKWCGTEGK